MKLLHYLTLSLLLLSLLFNFNVADNDSTSVQIQFENKLQEDLDIYWINPTSNERVFISPIQAKSRQNLNSYIGHIFAVISKSGEEIFKTIVRQAKNMYTIDRNDPEKEAEDRFREEYFNNTGLEWINAGIRPPTVSFIWPAPREGYKHLVNLYPPLWTKGQPEEVAEVISGVSGPGLNFRYLEVKSTSPKVFFIEDFLSDDECQHLIDVMTPDLKRSTVASSGILDENRTSRTSWIAHSKTPIVQNIVQRGFNLLRIPYNPDNSSIAAESVQGLHYGLNQWYREHYDYFSASDGEGDAHILAGNNRLATLFLYLSDVEEGGETYFPRKDGVYVDQGCTNPQGFKVTPKKRGAALFYSMLEDGNLDFNSLHGGCPVVKGNKYGSNIWFWDTKFRG